MNKIKLALYTLGFLFFLWIASWFGLFSFLGSSLNVQNENITPTQNVQEADRVTVAIDFGDENVFVDIIEIDENSTAFSVLSKYAESEGLEVNTVQYDFGVFVDSIDGFKSGSDKAWIYYINSESGQVAADTAKVNPGDSIEWKYVPPSME